MNSKYGNSLLLLVLLVVVYPVTDAVAALEDKKSYKVEDMSYEELNKMEILANEARTLYWRGQYQKALDIFNSLSKSNHPSTPLYYNESAQCQIALGNLSDAEKNLRNVDNFFLAYNSSDREQKALSNFGKEADKIYLGDPYERATNYLLLSMIYISRGDYENALAACKSGILADSDARENKVESDYTMLHLLEMKLHQLRGDNESALQSGNAVRTSYINSHSMVRNILSDKLETIEILAMSQDEREKLNIKETPAELQAKLKTTEEKLDEATKKVNCETDLGVLLTGDYNTLIAVPRGKGPHKIRKGKDGQFVVIETDQTSYQRPRILIDGSEIQVNPISAVADVNFHSVTRNGRKMDALLQGKAVSRATTVNVGASITDLGNRLGGYGGLAMVFIGLVTQGVGGAMSPEADTRCWQLLPSSFDIYAVNLPAGEHEVKVQHRIYFETQNETVKKISVPQQKGLIAVLASPAPVGRYSDITESDTEIKKAARVNSNVTAKSGLLLTPPLGLRKIDRFPPLEDGEKPEAVAVDWKKLVKRLEKRLVGAALQVEKVGHFEITNKYESLRNSYPLALQTDIEELGIKKDKDDKLYSLRITFSIVETATGKAVSKETVTGILRKTESDKYGSTDAYYKCFDDAFERFLAGKNITDMIKMTSRSASL